MPFRFGTRRSLGLPIGGGGGAILKPQDVFASKVYTGSEPSQKISLPFAPDFVWAKTRSQALQHSLWSRMRGARNFLVSNSTAAEATTSATSGVLSFDADGFTLGNNGAGENQTGDSLVAWALKYAPKFCVEVTWTGDGTSNRQIPHGLGVVPGMVIVKQRSGTQFWPVYHRSIGKSMGIPFNTTDAAGGYNIWADTDPTATYFTVTGHALVNQAGQTYVAYLFAHDPSADGIVQCGSFTTDANGGATVNTGYPLQFLMYKPISTTGSWGMLDVARGWGSGSDAILFANSPNPEVSGDIGAPVSTGASLIGFGSNATFIYLAIRAPY